MLKSNTGLRLLRDIIVGVIVLAGIGLAISFGASGLELIAMR
jgi:hypothetical protein